MRKYLVPGISLALASVGFVCRLAAGGEGAAISPSSGIWETVLTVYGPMGGMLVWFMHREKRRDNREDARDARLYALLEKCTEAMTTVTMKLTSLQADGEKTRLAIYQLKDAVLERGPVRGDTRVLKE